jgi:biotin carboxylase
MLVERLLADGTMVVALAMRNCSINRRAVTIEFLV